MHDIDYDVIVIGGGGGGMSAALLAAEGGARVLLVEAAKRCGGATTLSTGVFYAAGTMVQQAAGIEGDSAQAMFTYGMALNRYRMQPAPFRRYCEEGAGALHWLMDQGVDFPVDLLSGVDVSGVRRCHGARGKGAAIAETLEGRLADAGIDVATNSRVRDLIVENGAVKGIRVDGADVRAHAVIVATGGFGANSEMLKRHYPAAAEVEGSWYIGPSTSQGDGLALGGVAGADFYGDNRGLLLLSPGLHRTLEMPPGWLLFVNGAGRRFMNEAVPYCVFNSILDAQPDRKAFAIFDHGAFLDPPVDPRYAAGIADGSRSTDWKRDVLESALQSGRIHKADSLEDLARVAGIAPAALVETVRRHNADVTTGEDRLFFKDPCHLKAVAKGPFYAATMTLQIICFTSYGLRIDEEARVQDAAGRPIPGLFAAGEAAAGVTGEVYLGSGGSIAHAVTFGRIAGRNAALLVHRAKAEATG